MSTSSAGMRAFVLVLSWLWLDGGAPRPVAAAGRERLATAAATSDLALADSLALATGPLTTTTVVDVARTERLSLAAQHVELARTAVASGPGWVRERVAGVAGPLAFTQEADYFVVADLAGIDAVPLREVVGAEFEGFVKDRLRANALQTANPAERVYVLQKSALQAMEPIYLDRDEIEVDPYAHLDVTICVPMPVVGGIAAPSFSPEIVIREIAPGVLEYQELLQAGPLREAGRVLGSVDLRAVRALPTFPVTSGGSAPQGAVAQAATAGAMSCFNLRDILGDRDDGSCRVDLLDPSSWYAERDVTGTIDLTPPDARLPISIDTSSGVDAALAAVFDGTLRLDTEFSFRDAQGRGVGGKVKVRVGELFCVPLWLRPVEGRVWAHLDARRELEVNGTLQVGKTKRGEITTTASGAQEVSPLSDQLPDPREILHLPMEAPLFLYPIAFMVGPVPVALILDAPVEVGLEAGIASPTVTNFAIEGGLRAGFDYRCRFGASCVAEEPAHFEAWGEAEATGDVGLEGRAVVKPYLGIGLRASLYWPGAIYAKVVPRAFVNLELWGASKYCGDADGNGQEEFVNALTADLDAGVELVGEIGVYQPPTGEEWINDLIDFVAPVSFPIGDPLTWHLAYANLLAQDAGAFQPMLVAPATVREDAPASFGARMRPCYPYGDDVDYAVQWGDGGFGSASGDPAASAGLSHTWANPGAYAVKLTAVGDAHGRVFDEAFGTPLRTTLTRTIAVQRRTLSPTRLGATVTRRR